MALPQTNATPVRPSQSGTKCPKTTIAHTISCSTQALPYRQTTIRVATSESNTLCTSACQRIDTHQTINNFVQHSCHQNISNKMQTATIRQPMLVYTTHNTQYLMVSSI